MKIQLCIILSVLCLNLFGQSPSEDAVLQLVKLAVEENKMPSEVINSKDSTNHPSDLVAIQKTKENELGIGLSLVHNSIDYRICSAEELFTKNPYWITPSHLMLTDSAFSFEFSTNYMSTTKLKCYQGTIKGKKRKGQWVLLKCVYKESQCNYDLRKLTD
jgi:hypothetical protein